MSTPDLSLQLCLLETSLEHCPEAVFWIGTDGSLRYVNDSGCNALGYSKQALLSRTILEVSPNLTKEGWKRHWRLLKEKGTLNFESHLRTKEGVQFPVEISAHYVACQGQEFGCVFARDLRVRGESLKERRSENSLLVDQIAHDFANLMTALLSSLGLVRMELSANSELIPVLSEAEKAGRAAQQLTNQLLSMVQATEGTSDSGCPQDKQIKKRKKILIMDDVKRVRVGTGRMLQHLGFETKLASNGTEAIECYKEAQSSNEPFDAVLVDLIIASGMDGKETIKELLKIDPRVKAIATSGYFDDPAMTHFEKYGFSGVIAKPYKIDQLRKILNEVISG